MKIKKVTLILRPGHVDKISIQIEGTSPFPELEAAGPGKYPPYLEIQSREGYGLTWLQINLNILTGDPRLEVIDTSSSKREFFGES